MKSYDDLQRFKEKTQTGDIAFKDMSEQTRQADNSQWAIIQQLEGGEQQDPFLSVSASQFQPVGADVFASPSVSSSSSMTKPEISSSVKTTSESEGSLLASVAATFPSAASPSADQPALVDDDQNNSSDKGAEPVSLLKQTDEQISADPVGHPVSRYHSLFSTRRTPSVGSVSKETLLKPLLEKIALCH